MATLYLLNSPLINYFHYSTGANVGELADAGTLEFFKASDHATQQDTYADPAGATANPNPITLTAVGSWPPIYMLDAEYYIVIKDKNGNTIETLDNYKPNGGSGGSSAVDTEIENLCPSYGFESKIYPTLYTDNGLTLSSGANTFPLSLGWFLDVTTTDTTKKITYTYEALNNVTSTMVGNPKNELGIKYELSGGSGDTLNRLRFTGGYYNEFQGKKLSFAVYPYKLTGSFTELDFKMVRFKAGVEGTPVTLGSIAFGTSRPSSPVVINFTVLALTDSGYHNNDEIYFYLDLPNNADFEIKLTGTWMQINDTAAVNVSERSVQVSTLKQFYGTAIKELQSDTPNTSVAYPLVHVNGGARFAPNTGAIFLAPFKNSGHPYSIDMEDDKELIRNTLYNDVLVNRLIDHLQAIYQSDGQWKRSKHTVCESTISGSSYIEFTTGLPATEKTAWDASGSPQFTYAKQTTEWQMKMTATLDPDGVNEWNKIKLESTVNGAFTTTTYDPSTSNQNSDTLFTSGTDENPAYFVYNIAALSFDTDTHTTVDHSINGHLVHNDTTSFTNGGASSKFTATINIENNIVENVSSSNINDGDQPAGRREKNDNALFKTRNVTYKYDNTGISEDRQYVMGYLAWNGTSAGGTPPASNYILSPDYDSDGAPNKVTANTLNVEFSISSKDSNEQIAHSIVEAINNSAVHRFTYSGTAPASGEYLYYSSDLTDFILIFWNTTTTATKPANPASTRTAVYVEFATGVSGADLLSAMKTAVERGSIGIPTPNAMRFWTVADGHHYMHL